MDEKQTADKIRESLLKNGIFSSKEEAQAELELYQDYQITILADIIHRDDGTLTQTLALIEKTIDILKDFINEPQKNTRKIKRETING